MQDTKEAVSRGDDFNWYIPDNMRIPGDEMLRRREVNTGDHYFSNNFLSSQTQFCWGICELVFINPERPERRTENTWYAAKWLRRCTSTSSGKRHHGNCNCALEHLSHVPSDYVIYLGVSTSNLPCNGTRFLDHTHFPFDECDFCEQKQEPLMYLFKVRELGGDRPEQYHHDTAFLPRDHINVVCSSCYHGFKYEPVTPIDSKHGRPVPPQLVCPYTKIYGFAVPGTEAPVSLHKIYTQTDTPTAEHFPFDFGFVISKVKPMPLKNARFK